MESDIRASWATGSSSAYSASYGGTCQSVLPIRALQLLEYFAQLLGQPHPLLSARQAETVDALKQHCPGFTTMRRLVLSFRTILRVGRVATLRQWMDRAAASDIDALRRFQPVISPSGIPRAVMVFRILHPKATHHPYRVVALRVLLLTQKPHQ